MRGAKTPQAGMQIAPGAFRFRCHRVVCAVTRNIEPAQRGIIVVQQVVGPAEFQGDRAESTGSFSCASV